MARGFFVKLTFRRGWFWITAIALLICKPLGAFILTKIALKMELL
jgi:hypothetical protein